MEKLTLILTLIFLCCLITLKRKCSVLQTHANMMVNAWRRCKVTNVFVKIVTPEFTAKVRVNNKPLIVVKTI